jgi:TolB protein
MNQGYHSWSPNGKWIVFDASDLSNNNFDIYLMKWDGTEIQQLTSGWKYEQAPVFVEVPKE